MEYSTISVRIDKENKQAFDKFCNDVGMNTSTAISLFIKAVLRNNCIPFEISTDPFYSKENMARLRKSINQMEKTGGTIHEVEGYD